MPPYGTEHIIMLVMLVVASTCLVIWARRSGQTDRTERILALTGWVYLAISIGWSIWDLLPQNFTVEQSIPIHLSDVLRIITAIALICRNTLAIAITYFWGLTLNVQSILTPDLNYLVAPTVEFVSYWLFHGLAFVVPLVFFCGLRYRITWRAYLASFAALVAWAAVAGVTNALTGANYGYLAYAPAGPSLLDVMGGWPTYLAVEGVVILIVWALMTLPWELTHSRWETRTIGRMRILRRAL